MMHNCVNEDHLLLC